MEKWSPFYVWEIFLFIKYKMLLYQVKSVCVEKMCVRSFTFPW